MPDTPPQIPPYKVDLPPHDQRVVILATAQRKGLLGPYRYEKDGTYYVDDGDRLVGLTGPDVDRIAFDAFVAS